MIMNNIMQHIKVVRAVSSDILGKSRDAMGFSESVNLAGIIAELQAATCNIELIISVISYCIGTYH